MDHNTKCLNSVNTLELRFQTFVAFFLDIKQTLNSLDNKEFSMEEELSKLCLNLKRLILEKTQLDESRLKTEAVIDCVIELMKKHDFLKMHIEALKQRMNIQTNYSEVNGLDVEESLLLEKLNKAWAYFSDKSCNMDDQIKQLQEKLTKRCDTVLMRYNEECTNYRKLIEKFDEENTRLVNNLKKISQCLEI